MTKCTEYRLDVKDYVRSGFLPSYGCPATYQIV